MTALPTTGLTALLARKGEALPAARRSGPASWFGDAGEMAGYADAANEVGGAPLDDETVDPVDLAALITPARARPKRALSPLQRPLSVAEPRKQKSSIDLMTHLLNELNGEDPEAQEASDDQLAEPRRQMTLRLPMRAFERLKSHVAAEDITYQKALSDAVCGYLNEVVE